MFNLFNTNKHYTVNPKSLIYSHLWLSIHVNPAWCCAPVAAERVVGGPLSLGALILQSSPAHLRRKGKTQAFCTLQATDKNTRILVLFEINLFLFWSHLPPQGRQQQWGANPGGGHQERSAAAALHASQGGVSPGEKDLEVWLCGVLSQV